jgi:hypothetical protein
MTVKSMVGTLARTGVSTAVSVVRHPIGSASLAAGLVKGAAEAGAHVVRSAITGQPPAPARDISDQVKHEPQPAAETPEPAPERVVTHDPRDDIPGPDLAAFEPPAPEDLPEPVVIEAEPADGPGESFHNEPKPASRDAAHGGPGGEREEIELSIEELTDPDVDVETPVGTTGADVGHNPDTAEADLQQPGTPPLLDPGTIHAIESESEILRKAADPDKG